MAGKTFQDFSQAIVQKGGSKTEARQLYKRLQSSGYSNPTQWHASRAGTLLDRAFTVERKRQGVSAGYAKRELSKLKSEGFAYPSVWHARRVDTLTLQRFYQERRSQGVPDELIRKEAAKLKRDGVRYPGTKDAKKLPAPKGVFVVPKGKRVIRTVEQWLELLEKPKVVLSYEMWVSSLDY